MIISNKEDVKDLAINRTVKDIKVQIVMVEVATIMAVVATAEVEAMEIIIKESTIMLHLHIPTKIISEDIKTTHDHHTVKEILIRAIILVAVVADIINGALSVVDIREIKDISVMTLNSHQDILHHDPIRHQIHQHNMVVLTVASKL